MFFVGLTIFKGSQTPPSFERGLVHFFIFHNLEGSTFGLILYSKRTD